MIILKYLKPTSSTSGGSVGVKQTWRSYSWDSALKYRDYSFVAKSNAFSGTSTAEGYLELVHEYNGSGTDVSSQTSRSYNLTKVWQRKITRAYIYSKACTA